MSEGASIEALLEGAEALLAKQCIDTPKLDAEILLARALDKTRSYLMTWPEKVPSKAEASEFQRWLLRRAASEPVAYILGDQEFYGHLFQVSPAVLIPRPETEHLVEKALGWCRERGTDSPKILDLCTGSGCVGLTLALELPRASVTMSDLSLEALAVAKHNAESHDLDERVRVFEGNLFEPLPDGERFDLILANPPYVEESFRGEMQKDVLDYEPHMALFAADDGLTIIREIVAQASKFLNQPGLIAIEMGSGQSARVRSLWGPSWKNPGIIQDLGGHDRIAYAEHQVL
ncbi:MAG: peptide chain release factor N(5)-glutamine methyltransferase [Deltaproteobacteria bacterium]|nr:peptide chain release factor N(5)-glutamine methyltransferase [Deltaproteobacteria bacterium]MBT6489991.1 peptide chain release factor N(5)-glutamine methyltransferase [Deltaproteobacteria bacterium]